MGRFPYGRKDYYKHLNDDEMHNLKVSLNMEQVADLVCKCNYGLHRFLSAVIDIKRQSEYQDEREFADKLEQLLNEGYF